jgi:protein gp37
MADNTGIEWTDATWNPITGCSVVSPGCKHCYAMKLAGTRLQHHPSRAGLTVDTPSGPVWNGEVRFNEQWINEPLRWSRPRRIFVCAHGDLFHENVPESWIDQVFAVMALAPQHTFQVLTKRPKRMRDYLMSRNGMGNAELCRAINHIPRNLGSRHGALEMPLPNVWLGVSAEDQARADERIPVLLDTPAALRWISGEPLLGRMDLARWLAIDWQCSVCREFFSGRHQPTCPRCNALGGWTGSHRFNGRHYPRGAIAPSQRGTGLDWGVVGGESGPNARPMHPDWARDLRDQFTRARVPFLFKQWGEWVNPAELWADLPELVAVQRDAAKGDNSRLHLFPDLQQMVRVGKRQAGRHLDGILHDEYPVGGVQ